MTLRRMRRMQTSRAVAAAPPKVWIMILTRTRKRTEMTRMMRKKKMISRMTMSSRLIRLLLRTKAIITQLNQTKHQQNPHQLR